MVLSLRIYKGPFPVRDSMMRWITPIHCNSMRLMSRRFTVLPVLLCFLIGLVSSFDNTRFDNVSLEFTIKCTITEEGESWRSIGARILTARRTLTLRISNSVYHTIVAQTAWIPSINLANTCNPTDNATFAGTDLPDCSVLASDIDLCQSQGKIVTISLGGATGSVGFSSDSQAETFADTVWNLFLGGTNSSRPFGNAVLDGVDLDIESGSSSYTAFVNRIRTHASGASKTYYVTAAPQCPYPDSALGATLNAVSFDAVYVQFYNNVCGLNNYPLAQDWDFGLWDNWVRTISPNSNVKIYIGAPADSTAAGQGYINATGLGAIATQMRKSFPSFGGVMLWDASQAYANDRYDVYVKSALTAAGGTGFTYPSCSAPAYVSGVGYSGGSQVSYGGYIWQAKFYASSTPSNDPNGEWSAVSVCAGSPSSVSSTSSAPTSSPPSGGRCAGISSWVSGVVYTAGNQVVYGKDLWTANYWTESDPPNVSNGDWTNDGAC